MSSKRGVVGAPKNADAGLIPVFLAEFPNAQWGRESDQGMPWTANREKRFCEQFIAIEKIAKKKIAKKIAGELRLADVIR